MTAAGMILGTAAYMARSRRRGARRQAERRVGVRCVLYEMLTGTRAFEGEDVGDTLAAVLRGEPDWAALPATVPAAVRTLIRRCLERSAAAHRGHLGRTVRPRRPRECRVSHCARQFRDDCSTTTAVAPHGDTLRHVARRRRDGRQRCLVRRARHTRRPACRAS